MREKSSLSVWGLAAIHVARKKGYEMLGIRSQAG
jgi:hypothetical protein